MTVGALAIAAMVCAVGATDEEIPQLISRLNSKPLSSSPLAIIIQVKNELAKIRSERE
jgi:hypothetical protein